MLKVQNGASFTYLSWRSGSEGYREQTVGCVASRRAESAERVAHNALACGDLTSREAPDAMLDEFSASVHE